MKFKKVILYSSLILFQILMIAITSNGQTKSLMQYNIYAGNTHAHTAYTWSHGAQFGPGGSILIDSENVAHPKNRIAKPDWQKYQGYPAEHYALAKSQGLDFYVTSDHSQEAAFHPTSPDNAAWLATKKAALEATDKNFVAIVGFEYSENNSTNGKGHINVINSSTYLNALETGIDLPYLYKWLATVKPNGDGPVVASFNHPGPNSYNSFAYRDANVTNIITMLEVINSNKGIHYDAFIKALDSGWKVSPCSGNDNHGLGGIKSQNSRTFVLATAKTKAAILDAMKNRRTYASFDQNIQCSYTVNGKIMGSTLTDGVKVFKFDISINDPDITDSAQKIIKIDIVKDGGEVVQSFTPTPAYSVKWSPTIIDAANKYFFVRVWSAGSSDTTGVETPVSSEENSENAETSDTPKNKKPAKVAKAKVAKPVAWLAPVWTGR